MTTFKDRLKQGKDARKTCPRNTQSALGNIDRDPLPLIKASSEGRIKSLVELRYGRMLVSPSPSIAATPCSRPMTWPALPAWD